MDTTTQNEYTTDELLKEALWEHEMVLKGREAYEASLEGRNLSDTNVGHSLLMQMIPAVEQAIREKQEEGVDDIFNSKKQVRRSSPILLSMCDARNLAVAVCNVVLEAMLDTQDSEPVTFRGLLDRIEEAYIQAMGLQIWEQQDAESYSYFWNTQGDKLSNVHSNPKKASEKRRQLKHKLKGMYEAMVDQDDNTQDIQLDLACELLNCVGYTRMTRVSEAAANAIAEEQGWEAITVVEGEFCVTESAVGPFSDLFILRDAVRYGREERLMFLSEQAESMIDYSLERGAVRSISMRPMLVKPKRWILSDS